MSILGASSSSWSTEPSRNARVTTHTFVVFSFLRLRGETTNAFDLDDDDAEKEEPLRAENVLAKTTNDDGVDAAKIILFAFLLLRATKKHEYYSYTYTQNEEHKKMLSFFVSFGMNKKTNRKEHKKATLIDVGYIYYNNTCLLLRAYSFYSLLYN